MGDQPYLANQAAGRVGNFSDTEEDELIEAELKVKLGIFPNPISDKSQTINVNYATSINATTQVYITDLYGRTLIVVQPEKEVDSGTYRNLVDVSNLTPGIYLCTIIANNERKTEKLVVLK